MYRSYQKLADFAGLTVETRVTRASVMCCHTGMLSQSRGERDNPGQKQQLI